MKTHTFIDKATSSIVFERTFDASPEEVFDAWTNAEQIAEWWDPSGTPLAECEIDLKPGGHFRFVHASGHAPPFAGVYRLIERPAQLVFDAMGAVGTVSIQTLGAATLMTVKIQSPTPEHFAQLLKFGVDQGTAKTLDNLVHFLTPRGR